MVRSLAWCIALSALVAVPVFGEGGTWPPIGELAAGSPSLVAVEGHYAYVVGGTALMVIDISDAANPLRVGVCDIPGGGRGVAVAGSYAYIAAYTNGFLVVDVSDPANPTEVGSCNPNLMAFDVAVQGQYAYLANGLDGLSVVDISNPADPAEVGAWVGWGPLDGWANDVAVAGSFAYLVDQDRGLWVLDVSDPANPIDVRLVPTPGLPGPSDVALSGQYAYVAASDQGLQLIDISTPSSATEIGFCDTWGTACEVAISGENAYVADGGFGLQLVDISQPTAPARLGSWTPSDGVYRVAVSESYAYVVCNGITGFRVIDISDLWAPAEVGSLGGPRYALGLAVSGEYGYIADLGAGLRVIDVSDPAAPVEAARCSTSTIHGPGYAYGVALSGGYAYVANAHAGLFIIDIADPIHPTSTGGSVQTGGDAWDVTVSGQYACVSDDWAGLRMVDVSDVANPVALGSYDYEWGSAYSGDYAYVGDGISGLRVLDVSDAENPVEVAACSTAQYASRIAVSEPYAYVADGDAGLSVLDISNPLAPVLLGTCDTPGRAFGLAVHEQHAYVADREGGLRVIDVSDPANPTEVAYWDTSGDACDVVTDGSYVYLADSGWGLLIFPIYGSPAPPAADFSASPTNGPAPLTVAFTDLSTGDPTSWSWDFGDGGVSTEQNPTRVYADAGNYTVSLTVTNAGGSDTETKTDYISVSLPPPVADFSASPTGGTAPLTVDFTDISTGDPTSWEWDFGDSGVSTEQNPTHVYADAGSYTVSLTAANAGGSDTETKVNHIAVAFQDVDFESWACDEILACVDAGIVAGYGDGLYQPDWPVTRDQMAVYIARAEAWINIDDAMDTAPELFPDVPASFWAGTAIQACVDNNVVQGYEYPDPDIPGETFSLYAPTAIVTRDQMAVFIARSICDPTGDEGLVGYIPSDPRNFPDVPATGYGDSGTDPYWAYRYIEYCVEHGVVNGYEYPDPDTPGETFYLYQPLSPVTRDQMAVYIARAFGLST